MFWPFGVRRDRAPVLSCQQQYSEWLASRHEASLLPMKEDLALWINTILGTNNITAENFLDMLETGVVLCQLAEALQERMVLASNGKPFIRRMIHWRADAAPGSFFARDNTANFLFWCRKIGIGPSHLFESDDLVLRRHPRDVCVCLMQLGRIVSKYGVDPPGLVKLEKEIEKEEFHSLSSPIVFGSSLPSPSSSLFFPPSFPPPCLLPTPVSPITPPASPPPTCSSEFASAPVSQFEPEPEIEPEPESELEPEPEPESVLEPEPQPELEPVPELELEQEPEPKPTLEFEPELKPDLEHESELEHEPELKHELEHEPEPEAELEPEPQPESKPECELEPEPEPEPEPELEAEPEPEPEPVLEPEPEPKPELEPEPEPKPETELDPLPELEPEPEPEPELEPDPKAEKADELKHETEPEPKPKPDTELVPEPETELKPKPDPKPNPQAIVQTPTTTPSSRNPKGKDGLLDAIVKQISEDPPCTCDVRFRIEKQPKGHYRIGDKVLYVRMLNDKHVMVRVGGGWETLGTYLQKHDPCKGALPKPSKLNSKSHTSKERSRDSYLVVGTSSRLKKQMSQP
ncbi:growth arrest-specific protein 2 [Clarias gariepinus]